MSILNRRIGQLSRGVVLVLASAGLAACSSSVDRFSNYPDVNTASVPKNTRDNTVQRSTLNGSPRNGEVRPSWQQPRQAYQPPKRQAYKAPAATNGSVTVRSGQTMYSIARANGMSAPDLARANGISYPYTIHVGQRLRVPGVSNPQSPVATFTPQTRYRAANAPAPVKNYSGKGTHTVTTGETLFSLGRTYNVNPYTIARHNNIRAPYGLNVGQVVRIPSGNTSIARSPAPVSRSTQNLAAKKPVNAPKSNDRIAPAPTRNVEQTTIPQAPAPVTTTKSAFRWPVKGRVISSFGRKSNGMRNEGINIAVPAGTSVRAAEKGIVAYAGNELKGYGNLVLIRHSNGWVTAYAHNKELFVKRGDTVKRGDVIAKAGQTGSVNSPQLHFEVRKGSAAVDPMLYLSSQTAAAN